MPAAHRAPGAGRASSAPTGATGSSSSTTRRPRPRRSARCTGPSGHDGRDGRGQGAVPRRRRGAAVRPHTRSAGWRRLFGVLVPGLDVKPLVAELQGPGRRGARLRARGRGPARRSPTAFAGDPDIARPRRSSPAPSQVLVTRVDRRHAAVADHRRRAPRRSATAPACCSSGSCSPARRGPGCCTPTRTRATSGCSTTAASACSTSARSPGCRTACPRRSAAAAAGASTATPRACSTGCATRASSSRRSSSTPSGCCDYLAPFLEPVARRDVPVHPRLAAQPGGADRRPALAGVQHRAAAQPAAVVPADPPGDARRHRRAVPARGRGAVPGRARALAARLPEPRRPRKRPERSCPLTTTRGRACSPSPGRSPGCTARSGRTRRPRSTEVLQPSGNDGAVAPHSAQVTAFRGLWSGSRSVSGSS